jgi:TIR domain
VADIFVSYTRSDRDWANLIGLELEKLGHAPHIHEWEIKSGDDIYGWMEKRHNEVDCVLCVVSDDYLKAPYSTLQTRSRLLRHKRAFRGAKLRGGKCGGQRRVRNACNGNGVRAVDRPREGSASHARRRTVGRLYEVASAAD